MAIRTVEDLAKTQAEMLDRLRRQAEALRQGGGAALPLLREEKERELSRLRTRLGETEEGRQAAVERYDRQLEQQRAAIARLESELAQMQGYPPAAKGATGRRPARAKPKAARATPTRRKT
jgi:hypothetical protein